MQIGNSKYELNNIYNEDCLQAMKQIPDNSIDLIITSPPYNKGLYDKHTPSKSDVWKQRNIKYGEFNDDLPRDVYIDQQKELLKECIRVLKPNGSIFYNHKCVIHDHKVDFPTYIFDYNLRQIIIWDRGSSPQLAPIRWFPTTEYIFWITKTAIQPKFYRKGKFDSEVWRINPEKNNDHPAPFPLELVNQIIISCSDEGDIILDPYMGSCTTAISSYKLKRDYIGFEKDVDIFNKGQKRLDLVKSQISMF